MALSLKELKKNSNLAELIKSTEKLEGGYAKKDVELNFWKPTADKAGNGSAIIRFLPAPKGEDLPYVRLYNHGFKGPTDKWFIDNCPTTIADGTPCPICEMNNILWEEGEDTPGRIFVSGNPNVKPQRSGSKRKKSYIANILVVKDDAAKENVGKVFKYSFGQKIFDKIKVAMKGDEGTDTPGIEIFNFWEGANFKLQFSNSSGQRSYDASVFANPTAVAKTDAAIEAIWDAEYSLSAITGPDNIKTYEELAKKLDYVMKGSAIRNKTVSEASEDAPEEKSQEAPSGKVKASVVEEADAEADDDSFDKYLEGLGDE